MSYIDASRRLDGKSLTITIIANAGVAAVLLSIAQTATFTEFVGTPTTEYRSDPPPTADKPIEKKKIETRADPYIPPRATPLDSSIKSDNHLTPPPLPPAGGSSDGGALLPPVIPEVVPPLVERVPVLTSAKPDPRFASALQPPYPTSMIRAGLSGIVVVRVLVGLDGRVKSLETVRADEDAFLAATREQALKKWRFKPATRDGAPVEAWREMTVRFVLPD